MASGPAGWQGPQGNKPGPPSTQWGREELADERTLPPGTQNRRPLWRPQLTLACSQPAPGHTLAGWVGRGDQARLESANPVVCLTTPQIQHLLGPPSHPQAGRRAHTSLDAACPVPQSLQPDPGTRGVSLEVGPSWRPPNKGVAVTSVV